VARDPEFVSFIKKFVIGVGLGLVLGSTIKELINTIIKALIMPLLSLVLNVSSWETAAFTVKSVEFRYGEVVIASLNLFFVFLFTYLFVKFLVGAKRIPGT